MSGAFGIRRGWPRQECIRVSMEGQTEIDWCLPGQETEYWISFNLRHRPGWALIVKDEVKHLGWAQSLQELEQAMSRRLKDRRSKPV
jgi:hypothetical protein